MGEYNDNIKADACALYLQIQNITKVADIMGIPAGTISRWKDKGKWDKELKKQEVQVVNDAIDVEKTINDLARKFNLNFSDVSMLKQIKTIEKIILKTLKGKYDENNEDDVRVMRPLTFHQAIQGMKILWDVRLRIFSKPGATENKEGKISYIANVKNYYNKEQQKEG